MDTCAEPAQKRARVDWGRRIDASHGAGTLLDLTQMTTPIGAASTDGGTLSGGCGGGKDDSEPNDEDKPGVQINLKDPSSDSGSFEMLSSTSDSWEIPQSAIIVEHPSNGMNMPDATSDVEFESLGTTPPASPIPERAMPTPAPGPPEAGAGPLPLSAIPSSYSSSNSDADWSGHGGSLNPQDCDCESEEGGSDSDATTLVLGAELPPSPPDAGEGGGGGAVRTGRAILRRLGRIAADSFAAVRDDPDGAESGLQQQQK